jgi:TetR/AcrR family transcriptional regulator
MQGDTQRIRRPRARAMRDFRRNLIIEAARRVFAERGLAGASLRTIAAAAGCTTGAIYPYFSGKEEIYAEILNESLDTLRLGMEQRVAASADDPSRLHGAAAAFLDYYLERPVEIGLSLYLFDGVRPTGLTPQLNRDLNGKLMAAIRILEELICRIGGGMTKEEERTEGAMLFSYLMGLTIVHHTGRTRVIERTSPQLLIRHVDDLIERLQRAATAKRC